MILRFTLSNDISGSLVIEEPDGWKDSVLNLTRSEEFHSVVESYEEETFTFWDEAYDYIVNIRDTQGFDADINILIEISEDEVSYETIFTGLINIEDSKQIDFKKIDCPVVRNDLWTRFNNNKGTSINLQSPTDLYGNSRIAMQPITLNLSSQKVRLNYFGLHDLDIEYALNGSSIYGTLDFAIVEENEINEKYSYPRVIGVQRPFELFMAEFSGSYIFDSEIHLSDGIGFGLGNNYVSNIEVYLQINDDTPIAFTKFNQGTNGNDGRTKFSYSGIQTIEDGDYIRLYIQNTSGSSNTIYWLSAYASYLIVKADTTYPDTTCQAFMIHEGFQSVLDRIIGADNTLYSEYLGAEDTQQTDYTANGCASLFAITKGLHIKQYGLIQKPFYASFNDLWNGHNPIFNLGLGYETVDGNEYIRIEDKAHFYDPSISINLDYVNNIEVSIDSEVIFKKIKIGYQKWESESVGGIDDPQTKHEYAVALKKSGEEIDIQSSFIAASLAIEFTRRQVVEQTKDYKLDNNIFIIAIDKDIIGSPALVYEPELDEPFSSISNLLNSDARYNLRLTPARNFMRWRNYFNSGLKLYTDLEYQFVSGEGNVTMSSTVGTDTCISGTLVENQDIPITSTSIHDNMLYEFEHPLTWDEYKTIRDNRHKAIGVSSTGTSHVGFYIKQIKYNIHNSLGKFTLIKA